MMAGLDEKAREQTWHDITAALAVYDGPAGFAGPCELLIAAGTKE